MNDNSQLNRLQRVLQAQRWAALATVDDHGAPMASMVGYVCGDDATVAYLHLSRLAAHTSNLLANGKAALTVSEPDSGSGDPQQLARVTLQGDVGVVQRETDEYAAARGRYLERLPNSEPLFDFPDFILFRLNVRSARFVGGFAQARTFAAAELGGH